MIIFATAYCTEGLTATGTHTHYGSVAVDPRVIPLGSTLYIHGQQFTAEDTGDLVKGRRVDIFMHDCHEALNYGVKRHEIRVVVKR